MPYEDPDPEDPLELMAVELPGDPNSWREMAECFAVEFARMGWPALKLRELFSNPYYAGAYQARQVLGEKVIHDLIAEALFIYGTRRSTEPVEASADESAPPYPPPGPCERP